MKDLDMFTTKSSRWKDSKQRMENLYTAETSRTNTQYPAMRSSSVKMNFPQLVTTLNSNPFQGHAQINNSSVSPFTK